MIFRPVTRHRFPLSRNAAVFGPPRGDEHSLQLTSSVVSRRNVHQRRRLSVLRKSPKCFRAFIKMGIWVFAHLPKHFNSSNLFELDRPATAVLEWSRPD